MLMKSVEYGIAEVTLTSSYYNQVFISYKTKCHSELLSITVGLFTLIGAHHVPDGNDEISNVVGNGMHTKVLFNDLVIARNTGLRPHLGGT